MASDHGRWEKIAKASPSWYLDPEVARQKREVHLALVRLRSASLHPQTVLKTDLFEEAFGSDDLLRDLAPDAQCVVGIDIAPTVVAKARTRNPGSRFSFAVTDVRAIAFDGASFDLLVSNSTLDHFDTPDDLRASLKELARVLRPGGLLIVTLDNPYNPLYFVLRWATRSARAPFKVGCTLTRSQLNGYLEDCGLDVVGNDWLIHNPRLVSTTLFLAIRKVFGRRAGSPIRGLLALFSVFGHLPTRRFTACFVAASARKRDH